MLRKAKWLVKEALLRFKYMATNNCIFCKIVSGEIKNSPILETKKTLGITDINPVAEVHILIFPKRHIESIVTLGVDDCDDIMDMFSAAKKLIVDRKLAAYRLTINGGKYQHIPHLHMHLVAGKSKK